MILNNIAVLNSCGEKLRVKICAISYLMCELDDSTHVFSEWYRNHRPKNDRMEGGIRKGGMRKKWFWWLELLFHFQYTKMLSYWSLEPKSSYNLQFNTNRKIMKCPKSALSEINLWNAAASVLNDVKVTEYIK